LAASEPTTFTELGLPAQILKTLESLGYQAPTPVQSQSIPTLLAGEDLLGHAPTGTGKTAAFSLPLLARIDPSETSPQVLVLTPTRELAIQVTAAIQGYSKDLSGVRALAIYGGQDYGPQLRQLRNGQHIVVGTPGRVMDHIRRGTLVLTDLKALVLDEADEMLNMGFLEDVEWILEQAPEKRQMALFSATMPKEISRIAKRFMTSPKTIAIEALIGAKAMIQQQYCLVAAKEKPSALQRMLAFEAFDAVLIFVRTKLQTVSVAEAIARGGHQAAAIHGDLAQNQREQIIRRLSKGQLDIVVATDVAARGLDVDRISHVINYDPPHDAETYVHRIGRTGRAGRSGRAIIFLAKRDERRIKILERETQNKLTPYALPSPEMIRSKQLKDFKETLMEAVKTPPRDDLVSAMESVMENSGLNAITIAATIAQQLLPAKAFAPITPVKPAQPKPSSQDRAAAKDEQHFTPARGMAVFRIAVGNDQSVEAREIVGAIANEGGLNGKEIGTIRIFADHSLVELPNALPRTVFTALKNTWVRGRRLGIYRLETDQAPKSKRRSNADDARKKPNQSRSKSAVGKRRSAPAFSGKKAASPVKKRPAAATKAKAKAASKTPSKAAHKRPSKAKD
jgi:ATP-dependent RNA helicase DeaD